MRILGGILKGRAIAMPKGDQTRPITALLRKSLFDILGERIIDAKVLDLFAGSGAIGIEALSRGALHTHFIDSSPHSIRCLKKNMEDLELTPTATVIQSDAFVFIERYKQEPFDLIFLDPPYPFGLPGYTKILQALAYRPTLFHPETLFILEAPAPLMKELRPNLSPFTLIREKASATTALLFLHIDPSR